MICWHNSFILGPELTLDIRCISLGNLLTRQQCLRGAGGTSSLKVDTPCVPLVHSYFFAATHAQCGEGGRRRSGAIRNYAFTNSIAKDFNFYLKPTLFQIK